MYANAQQWFKTLKSIAKENKNESAITDFEGWTSNWENESPSEAYYNEFPNCKVPNADA